MDFRTHLLKLNDFLQNYQDIYLEEVLFNYPNPLKNYPSTWVEEIYPMQDLDSALQIERKSFKSFKNHELNDFYNLIDSLTVFPKLNFRPVQFSKESYLHLGPKKTHEISRLAPLVNSIFHQFPHQNVIDLGGGVGFLATTLSDNYQIPVISIDQDSKLQKTGFERLEKHFAHCKDKLQFKNIQIGGQDQALQKYISPDTLTLGLHTCGNLAHHQLKQSIAKKARSIINLGCCYFKEVDPKHALISKSSQLINNPILLNTFALTLASRGHRKIDEKQYLHKIRVKFYRYSLFMLLYDQFKGSEQIPLGNSHHTLYQGSFYDYVNAQFKHLKLTLSFNREQVHSFYDNSDRQALIWKMIAADHIRNALGRALEVYLLVDRALYLEENNYQVEILELFDEAISPRNLALVATAN